MKVTAWGEPRTRPCHVKKVTVKRERANTAGTTKDMMQKGRISRAKPEPISVPLVEPAFQMLIPGEVYPVCEATGLNVQKSEFHDEDRDSNFMMVPTQPVQSTVTVLRGRKPEVQLALCNRCTCEKMQGLSCPCLLGQVRCNTCGVTDVCSR